MSDGRRVLKVGVIGCGEVAQVIWLPTLHLLSRYFQVKAIDDASSAAIAFCLQRYPTVVRRDAKKICSDADIDVVFVLSSDDTHEKFVLEALANGVNVFVEKPMTLSHASAKRIIEAEAKAANGARVFVGYMRRYAPSFVQAFKQEVADIPRIRYARVRDFTGPNSHFISQSGIETIKPSDISQADIEARDRSLSTLFGEAWKGKSMTDDRVKFWRFLGSLGSHDLALMREVLGSPASVAAVSANDPYYSAMLDFRHENHSFTTTYESGIDQVPRFDAHLAVYGERKTVSIQYDTPYVKGLPIKVRVEELDKNGQAVTRDILSSYEDAYTAEAKELYECLVNGKEIKTSAVDAAKDLELFESLFDKYEQSRS